MNWEQIKNKYPKAIAKMLDWADYKSFYSEIEGKDISAFEQFEIDISQWLKERFLYELFDENVIFIAILLEVQYTREIDENGKNPHYDPEGWGYNIHNNSYSLAADSQYKTRQEAETAAFEKAFEILEEKL